MELIFASAFSRNFVLFDDKSDGSRNIARDKIVPVSIQKSGEIRPRTLKSRLSIHRKNINQK